MLDKSFPEPKALARLHLEIDPIDEDHKLEVEVKMQSEFVKRNMTPQEIDQYSYDYFLEYIRERN